MTKTKTFTLTEEEIEQLKEIHKIRKSRSLSATLGGLISSVHKQMRHTESDSTEA